MFMQTICHLKPGVGRVCKNQAAKVGNSRRLTFFFAVFILTKAVKNRF